MKKQSIVTISILVFSLFSFANGSDGAKKKSFFEDASITVKTPKIKIPKGEFLFLSTDGRVRIYPSDDLNGYIRSEKVNLGVNLNPNIVSNLSTEAKIEATAEFVRLYKEREDAFKLGLEFKPKNLPHTAKKALRLNAGDYFRVQTKAAFSLGISASSSIVSALKLQVGAEIFAYSDFQFEVYKKKDSKVFVRGSSLEEEGMRIFARVKSGLASEIIDLGFLDKLLPKFIDFNILTRTKGSFFSVEYEYDLSDERARVAYDNLLNYDEWDVADFRKVLGPYSKGGSEAIVVMLAKIEPSEKLSKESADSNNYVVRRGVRSSIEFEKISTGVDVNLLFVKADSDESHVDQKFSVMRDHTVDVYDHYRISSVELKDGWSVYFKKYFEEVTQRANMIFTADEKGNIEDFKQLNFSYERLESNLSEGEGASVQKRLKKLFPEEIYEDVIEAVSRSGASSFISQGTTKFEYAVSVDGKVFAEIAKLEDYEIKSVVEEFFIDLSIDPSRFGIPDKAFKEVKTGEDAVGVQNLYQALKGEINLLSATLIDTFSKNAPVRDSEERWSSLTKLQHSEFFQAFGSGVLMRLAHKAVKPQGKSLRDFLYLSIIAKTRDASAAKVEYGDYSDQNRFLELLELKDSVLSREYDTKYLLAD